MSIGAKEMDPFDSEHRKTLEPEQHKTLPPTIIISLVDIPGIA